MWQNDTMGGQSPADEPPVMDFVELEIESSLLWPTSVPESTSYTAQSSLGRDSESLKGHWPKG